MLRIFQAHFREKVNNTEAGTKKNTILIKKSVYVHPSTVQEISINASNCAIRSELGESIKKVSYIFEILTY